MNRPLRGAAAFGSASLISRVLLYLSAQSRCQYPAFGPTFNPPTMAETGALFIRDVSGLYHDVPVPAPMARTEAPEEEVGERLW